MLILGRRDGESIYIGPDIKVTMWIRNGQIKVGIEAPREYDIWRGEQKRNKDERGGQER